MPTANDLPEVLETTEPERLATGFIFTEGRTATGISSICAAISCCA
jgi:hypothetical protein